MAVGLSAPGALLPVPGIKLATAAAGIRYQDRDDLVLIALTESTSTAAVFTQNAFCAAPVITAKKHLHETSPRFLLINSGNANAGTGRAGLEIAQLSCRAVAKEASVTPAAVLPFSTGVIGEQLLIEKINRNIPALFSSLNKSNWLSAAQAIMTTDTVAKGISRQVEIDGKKVTITGIAKGSGMICPDMATMLAFVATDAAVEKKLLQTCLQEIVGKSFNSITVDGDTSTNDACVLMASGMSEIQIKDDAALEIFKQVLAEVFIFLAQAIIRDAEGATKFITIQVESALNKNEAREVAYTVAHSPLVKTALFASDPNWGRVLAAVGRAPVDQLDIAKVDFNLGDICVIRGGEPAPDYTEEKGQEILQEDEVLLRISLGRGPESATIWTSDLSHEYVSINADYRS
ncbi:MAG TPA: bifunctional glutamate N-acetyltransferase/amino-acid acetyltransferase ArgJ [Chromatiales bacterium]|nr:bifunctional glutamate N-acetyltransferase/amino-acid acetyltransferase ArgJ [Thiotrichales bacterium]HIP68725.1 bifunctional glutamate N-acetyltransferase/amino-acid acetyltransferase ArgJ [Chromatiales bacterium]